jgi:hypothetical protein
MSEATYTWEAVSAPGQAVQIRARCTPCDTLMAFTLKVDSRYGRTQNRYTKGPTAVEYLGRMVQAWQCPTCKQWVVK